MDRLVLHLDQQRVVAQFSYRSRQMRTQTMLILLSFKKFQQKK